MVDQFSNHQIEIGSLPSIETLELKGLHKDYLTAKMMGALVFWIIFGAVALSAIFFNDGDYPYYLNYVALSLLLFIMILRFSLLYLGFHKKKYALRERDILYKTGLLWRSNTVIPFNRIQHAEVNQGPLDRLFNLAILRVFTAGGGSSDMVIPGLRPAEAQNIKEFILKRTAFDEEE